jgi:hypothetical protein
MDGGDGGRETSPGNARPDATTIAKGSLEGRGQPVDQDRLGTPERFETVDLDLEQAERRIGGIGRTGDAGAEHGQRIEGAFGTRLIALGVWVDEDGFRDEPMRAPEGHPTSNAQSLGLRVGVHDVARIPWLPAEDERAGRKWV